MPPRGGQRQRARSYSYAWCAPLRAPRTSIGLFRSVLCLAQATYYEKDVVMSAMLAELTEYANAL